MKRERSLSSKLRQWMFVFITAAFLWGCTSTSPIVRIFPNDFPKVGHRVASQKVQGEDCGSQSLLWFRITPGPRIYKAIQNAIASAGPSYNALSEVQVYEQMHTGVFFTYYCFLVTGYPVRYGKGGLPKHYAPSQHSNQEGTKESQWNF